MLKIAVVGIGNVGKRLLTLLEREIEEKKSICGYQVRVVVLADSSGVAELSGCPQAAHLVSLAKEETGALARVASYGHPGILRFFAWHEWYEEMVTRSFRVDYCRKDCQLAFDCTPPTYHQPEESIARLELLMSTGWHVVTANKAPLAAAYDRLLDKARECGTFIGYTATTGLTLPSVSQLSEALCGSSLIKLEGVLNGTSGYVLSEMENPGVSYETAIEKAIAMGIAEPNPSLDIDGWDTAAKLVILFSTLIGRGYTLGDVDVTGIGGIESERLASAREAGKRIKLLGRAEPVAEGPGVVPGMLPGMLPGNSANTGPFLEVRPVELDSSHPLFGLSGTEKGLIITTDKYGSICIRGGRSGVETTANVMMRDMRLGLGKNA